MNTLQKNRDNKYFKVILYEQSFIGDSKTYILLA